MAGAVVARCGGGSAGAGGGMGSSNRDRGFWKWYRTPLSALGFATSEEREQREAVVRARMALSGKWSWAGSWHSFPRQHSDHLRAPDVDEQKRNRLREAGLDVRWGEAGHPYPPYSFSLLASPGDLRTRTATKHNWIQHGVLT